MSDERPEDRRRSARAEVLLQVQYSDPRDLLNDYITNLGDGGIFIRTTLPFERGQHLTFALSFPGLLEPIPLRGVVCWRRRAAEDPQNPPGVGVELLFDNDTERWQLKNLFATLACPAPPAAVPATGFRVLVVDDNPHVLELFDYAIRMFRRDEDEEPPLESLAVPSAREALDILEAQPVNLAIIDHYLPGMTGCELVTHLRGQPQHRHTPALVVSVGGDEVRRMAYACGADLFLDKPVRHVQLIQTITALLRAGER